MELKDLSKEIAIELLKNPLIMSLFIIGIISIIVKYVIPIIKNSKKRK